MKWVLFAAAMFLLVAGCIMPDDTTRHYLHGDAVMVMGSVFFVGGVILDRLDR